MQRIKKVAPYLSLLPVAAALALFLAFPKRYAFSVSQGISLWAITVLPATLPFLFLTSVLTRMKAFPKIAGCISPLTERIFRVSGTGGIAALLSMLSGYPVGARLLGDMKENGAIAGEECFRVAALASTSGPMFLVGCVGAGMFRSAAIGWELLLCHLTGVIAVCFFLRFTVKKGHGGRLSPPPPVAPIGSALPESVLSALTAGGAICIFYAFAAMLKDGCALAGLNSPLLQTVLTGLTEMTAGCQSAAALNAPYSAALACFFVTFGGGCVLLQQLIFLPKEVRPLPFIAIKFVQAAFSAALVLALELLL